MKHIKRITAVLITLALILGMAVTVFADYTFKVRIFAGNEGTVNGSSMVEYDVAAGEYIRLNTSIVNLPEDSIYYVKGFRLTGEEPVYSRAVFRADRDYDFTVVYGIRGNQVSYTIYYVEAGTGVQLLEPMTFYGNEGDQPVVAFQYVEGYRPVYENISAVLGPEGTNNWTFEYERIVVPEPETQPATTPAADNTPAGGGGAAPAGGGGGAAPAGEGGEAAPGPEGEGEGIEIPENEVPMSAPQQKSGFTIAGQDSPETSSRKAADSGLGEGAEEGSEEGADDGLEEIDESLVPMAGVKKIVSSTEIKVLNETYFTFVYVSDGKYKGRTSFPGSIAQYLEQMP